MNAKYKVCPHSYEFFGLFRLQPLSSPPTIHSSKRISDSLTRSQVYSMSYGSTLLVYDDKLLSIKYFKNQNSFDF